MLAEKAITLVGRYLRRAVTDGNDLEAREGMALAATLGGLAFSNVGVAVVHALEYPVGGASHCSHGAGNGLLLPYVMRYNLPARRARVRRDRRLLGEDVAGLERGTRRPSGAIAAVEQLRADIGIPARLRDLGVTEEQLPAFAEKAFAHQAADAGQPADAAVRGRDPRRSTGRRSRLGPRSGPDRRPAAGVPKGLRHRLAAMTPVARLRLVLQCVAAHPTSTAEQGLRRVLVGRAGQRSSAATRTTAASSCPCRREALRQTGLAPVTMIWNPRGCSSASAVRLARVRRGSHRLVLLVQLAPHSPLRAAASGRCTAAHRTKIWLAWPLVPLLAAVGFGPCWWFVVWWGQIAASILLGPGRVPAPPRIRGTRWSPGSSRR